MKKEANLFKIINPNSSNLSQQENFLTVKVSMPRIDHLREGEAPSNSASLVNLVSQEVK